jgi:hypothetical protein
LQYSLIKIVDSLTKIISVTNKNKREVIIGKTNNGAVIPKVDKTTKKCSKVIGGRVKKSKIKYNYPRNPN